MTTEPPPIPPVPFWKFPVPGWLPWTGVAIAAVCVAVSVRSCSVALDDRARYQADAKRSADALAGSDRNLAALKLAVEHKDEKIRELDEKVKHFGCDGTWTEVIRTDGSIERRCVGKARSDEADRGSRSTDKTTPDLAQPFTAPVPLQPSAFTATLPRFSLDGGAGVSIAHTLPVTVYGGSFGWRPFGPIWVRAWAHVPATTVLGTVGVTW